MLCLQSEYFKNGFKDKVDQTKQFRFKTGRGHAHWRALHSIDTFRLETFISSHFNCCATSVRHVIVLKTSHQAIMVPENSAPTRLKLLSFAGGPQRFESRTLLERL